MTNANSIIHLRNTAIIWGTVALISFGGAWWIYGFFGSTSAPVVQKVEALQLGVELIQKE